MAATKLSQKYSTLDIVSSVFFSFLLFLCRLDLIESKGESTVGEDSIRALMPCVSGMVNMAEIFGVPLKTLEDIDKLTKGIEIGKYEAVWSGMTSEKRKVVMDAIFAIWNAFVAANPSGTYASGSVNSGSLGSMAKDTLNLVDTMQIDESHIVHSVSVQEKPSSYVGAVGGSKPKPRGSSFARCLIEINADDVLKESLNMGVPLIKGSGFTIETVNIEYEPTATTDVPKKGATKKNLPLKASVPPTKEGNITVSNSYATLDDESAEEVENVYDELSNLLNSTKTGESSSTFTVAAG
ncbi:hypothetical protein Tco_1132586 [Tanacetum coccineum]|uniref:Uncharacterized protein n=1 Tax=Tanacetum coccineum TaxID=301880 RepID=A0ABQ5JE29_9ASTR